MHTTTDSENGTMREVATSILKFWLATILFCAFVSIWLSGGSRIWAGLLLVASTVLGMNGMAKTAIALTNKGPRFWREHSLLQIFHKITDEGELTGILFGLFTWLVIHQDVHVHIPVFGAGALLGIMSMATMITDKVRPILGILERTLGRWAAIALASLLASLTGEPAAAVFWTDYFGPRVKPASRAKVASGSGATIGSGGGLLPFAAPPVLIIWKTLVEQFGWNIATLVVMVGIGCVGHVLLSTTTFYKEVEPARDYEEFKPQSLLPILALAALVTAHVLFEDALWLVGVDVVIGVLNIRAMYGRYQALIDKKESEHEKQELKEERFRAAWQPLVLAALLVALDVIGAGAEPFIMAAASLIPTTWPVIFIMVAAFFATSTVSHVADNALASRVFIMVAVALIPVLGARAAELVAVAVVLGALFGGFLTIPANLPNFAISRYFKVDSGPWFRAALRLYPTVAVMLAWMSGLFVYYTYTK